MKENYQWWLAFHHACSRVRNGMTSADIKYVIHGLLFQSSSYASTQKITVRVRK